MTKLSLADFITFCNTREPEEIIKHETWCTCAVGLYFASKGVEISYGFEEIEELVPEEHKEEARLFRHTLEKTNVNTSDSLFAELNDRYYVTFGDLTERLKEINL